MAAILLACGTCAIVLGLTFVLIVALTLSVTSDSRIERRLKDAIDGGILTRAIFPVSPYGHTAHHFDMFTECMALGINLGNTDERLLSRAASDRFIMNNAAGQPCSSLVDAIEAGNARASEPYIRFWHGYQVYQRPLLNVMSLQAVRRVTAILLYGVLIFVAYRFALWFGPLAWPVLLVPPFLISDFLTVPAVTSHAISLIWVFFSAALAHVILSRFPNPTAFILPVFAFAAGAITNFLGFLLNPPLAPALIGFLVTAQGVGRSGREASTAVAKAVVIAAIWFLGFYGAWAEKWIFASLILGPDVVIAELTTRLGAYRDFYYMNLSHVTFMQATWMNLTSTTVFLAGIVFSWIAAVATVAFVFLKRGRERGVWVDFFAMVTPLLVVIVWVESNRIHSAIHALWVSRSFLLFSILPLLAAAYALRRNSVSNASSPLR